MSQADLSALNEDRTKKLLQLSAQLKGEPNTPKPSKGKKESIEGDFENDDPNYSVGKGASSALKPLTPAMRELEELALKKFTSILTTPRRGLPMSASSAQQHESPRITHKPRDLHMELWQSKVSTRVSAALSKEEKDRQEAIFELILTETKFTELLTEISQLYINPLSEIVTPSELRALFSNVAELIQIHTAFLEEIRQRRDDGLVVERLGDVLQAYIQGDLQFRKYIEFSSNHQRMDAEAKRLIESNPRMAAVLEEVAGSNIANHLQGNLREDLFKPTSRLMKYQVIIKSILDKTPVGHVDHEDLVSAHESMIKLIVEVNEEKRIKEGQDRIAVLLDVIDFGAPSLLSFVQQTVAENPRLAAVLEGEVTTIEVSGNKLKKKKAVRVISAGGLVLLLAKQSESSSGKIYKLFCSPAKLQHVVTVDIEDMVDDKVELKDLFEIRISEPEPLLLVVQASTRREKANLMESLGIKDELKVGAKKHGSFGSSVIELPPSMNRSTSSSSTGSGDASLPPLPTLKRKPSKKIGDLVSRFEPNSAQASSETVVTWPLSDQQMGLEDEEVNAGRFYCLVKSHKGGDWLPIGPGDILLAKAPQTSRSRVIFFHKEDLFKAKINCWLHPLVGVERVPYSSLPALCFYFYFLSTLFIPPRLIVSTAPKTVILILPIKNDQVATYSVQLKTVEEAGELFELVSQLKRAGVQEELDESLVAEIKKQLDGEESLANAQGNSFASKPPMLRQDSVRSVTRRRSITPALSRSSSRASLRSVSSVISEESTQNVETSSGMSNCASEEDVSRTAPQAEVPKDALIAPATPGPDSSEKTQPQTGGKDKKGKVKVAKKSKKSEKKKPKTFDEVTANMDIPEGPIKEFTRLLWEENQSLKETVAKLEKKKAKRELVQGE